MTDKIFTATDLEFKEITLQLVKLEAGNGVMFKQKYAYVGDDGKPVQQLGRSTYNEVRAIADIPANIMTALQTIQNYLQQKAYEQEGMSDE